MFDPENKIITLAVNLINFLLPLPLGVMISIGTARYIGFNQTWVRRFLIVILTIALVLYLFLLFLYLKTLLWFPGRYDSGVVTLLFLPSLLGFPLAAYITKKLKIQI